MANKTTFFPGCESNCPPSLFIGASLRTLLWDMCICVTADMLTGYRFPQCYLISLQTDRADTVSRTDPTTALIRLPIGLQVQVTAPGSTAPIGTQLAGKVNEAQKKKRKSAFISKPHRMELLRQANGKFFSNICLIKILTTHDYVLERTAQCPEQTQFDLNKDSH